MMGKKASVALYQEAAVLAAKIQTNFERLGISGHKADRCGMIKKFISFTTATKRLQPIVGEFSHHWCEFKSATIGCTNGIDSWNPLAHWGSGLRIVKCLPKELKGQLPGPEEIARLLEGGE